MGDNPTRHDNKPINHHEGSVGYTEGDIPELKKWKEEEAKRNKSKKNIARKYRFRK